ncbi:hypothetical protein CDD80_370 [Ophiocordyceps camponoti-rufipedis]|uniref:Nicotianamine synthase n=1 Tax=Ophiocordyceps camponoti-rufipedis TaxID=2004952 RepID=A0A2C5ZLM3_9HYPO|nr:hypothetical protein CDD80_370 [Ophiocordyceps camponoti-rufipedis]
MATVDYFPTPEAYRLIEEIAHIHDGFLSLLPNLTTCNEELGNLWSRLVQLCCGNYNAKTVEDVLQSMEMQRRMDCLRVTIREAKLLVNQQLANELIESAEPKQALSRLPNYKAFKQLFNIEWAAIETFSNTDLSTGIFRVAVIGSGPVPLTSLFVLNKFAPGHYFFQSENEGDKSRAETAKLLNMRTGTSPKAIMMKFVEPRQSCGIEFFRGNVEDISLKNFDIVYVPQPLGPSQMAIETKLARIVRTMKTGAVLVIRSGWGLRSCLYAELDFGTDIVKKMIKVEAVVRPLGEVTMSSVIATVIREEN